MLKKHQHNLTEGLRAKDLKEYVSDIFTVDQYKSKMGDDQDVVVLGFRVKEKYPATDLMEFMEKGYTFILDADMSAGEEMDGQYQVFVEIARTPGLPGQLKHLMSGISQLCDCYDWKFKYYKSAKTMDFSPESVSQHVPMTPQDYQQAVLEDKTQDIQEFFNQGATSVALESDSTITFSKPYAGDVTAKLVAIGDYDAVKATVPGHLALDESSHGQVTFLNKYLGNYDINKIGNKFLIRNGDQAVVIEKDRW
jgi:hypothetical protein